MQLIKEKCLVAGSFDPVTKGHMHLVGMAAMTFSQVIVAIGINDEKKYFFTLAERLDMLKSACAKYSTVKVEFYNGLTADFMRENDIKYFVRGVRNDKDAVYEEKVFKEISKDNKDVQLLLFNSPKELNKISSTFVKELIVGGKPYEKYLPYEIIEMIEEYSKLKRR